MVGMHEGECGAACSFLAGADEVEEPACLECNLETEMFDVEVTYLGENRGRDELVEIPDFHVFRFRVG